MTLTLQARTNFRQLVWEHYHKNHRTMPWRQTHTPYFVLVSELMLQQTQVPRVKLKFRSFVARFPTLNDLAHAPLGDVLAAWSGLGYNRRAKFLWQAARTIALRHGGRVPQNFDDLVALPGIGPHTAGAILAYAYNQPAIFIETNIRTVFIHHFFAEREEKISDAELYPLVEATLDTANPREWYWALMDYGSHLKGAVGAQLHRVKGYQPQSRFAGSRRQVRGRVIKILTQRPQRVNEFGDLADDNRLPSVLSELQQEGFITLVGEHWQLAP